MRFVLGPIPPSETIDALACGWSPMASSNELRWVRVASITGMLLLLVAGFLSLQRAAFAADVNPWFLVAVIASTALLIPLHELVHCLGYLVSLRSRNLITGIWPAAGTWYVVYDSPLPRWRALLMLAAPLLCLSILPCLALPFLSASNAWALTYVVLVQAGLCVGDLITFIRMWLIVPPGSLVHNCGWTTCWKELPADAKQIESIRI